MAIKNRAAQSAADRAAAIAAFGDGAAKPTDPDTAPATETPTDAPKAGAVKTPAKARGKSPAAGAGEYEAPATSMIRWPDASLPEAIEQIRRNESRGSFHNALLRVIQAGIDALDEDANR